MFKHFNTNFLITALSGFFQIVENEMVIFL
jgi:hypothetical protein